MIRFIIVTDRDEEKNCMRYTRTFVSRYYCWYAQISGEFTSWSVFELNCFFGFNWPNHKEIYFFIISSTIYAKLWNYSHFINYVALHIIITSFIVVRNERNEFIIKHKYVAVIIFLLRYIEKECAREHNVHMIVHSQHHRHTFFLTKLPNLSLYYIRNSIDARLMFSLQKLCALIVWMSQSMWLQSIVQ